MSRIDSAGHLISAPVDRVFAALVDARALERWLPPAGMTGRFEHFDARPGGSYRLVLTYRDASGSPGKSAPDADVVEVRFIEIVPGSRVVQEVDFVAADPSLAGAMTMTWSVTPVDDGTLVEISARNVPAGISPEDHAAGFASSLRNLEQYVTWHPAQPAISRSLDAVFVHVSDVGRSLAWYAALLGIPEGTVSHEGHIADLPVEGATRVILDGYGPVTGQPADHPRPRLMFATHDIEAAIAQARAIGADPTPVEDIGSAVVIYVSDPDGNRVCLIQRK